MPTGAIEISRRSASKIVLTPLIIRRALTGYNRKRAHQVPNRIDAIRGAQRFHPQT